MVLVGLVGNDVVLIGLAGNDVVLVGLVGNDVLLVGLARNDLPGSPLNCLNFYSDMRELEKSEVFSKLALRKIQYELKILSLQLNAMEKRL